MREQHLRHRQRLRRSQAVTVTRRGAFPVPNAVTYPMGRGVADALKGWSATARLANRAERVQ